MADLKPLELGEILDGTFTLYRRHFLMFMKLGAAALGLPVAIDVYLVIASGSGGLFVPGQSVPDHLGLRLITVVLRYFGTLFLTAGTVRVISDAYLGRQPDLGDAVGLGLSKLGPLFAVGLAQGLVVMVPLGLGAGLIAAAVALKLGAIAIVLASLAAVVGVYFGVAASISYTMTTPIVVLEDLSSSLDALRRAWGLSRGYRGKIFGTLFIVGLVAAIPTMVAGGVAGAAGAKDPAVLQWSQVVLQLMPVLLTPLTTCAITLLYYDLRVRREAFDLQILGQQLGIA
ncbi:MAG TPA: hypothetical protein VFK78_04880 [Gemmatimonadales bacterium]|nr:hypothetical protein [Gemmatimonadales bacterium]